MIAKGEKIAKSPSSVAAKVEAPTPVQQAPSGKRTSNAKSNVATAKRAAATKAPGPVVSKTPAKRGRKPRATVAA